MPDLPHKRRTSDGDIPQTQMDYFFMNRKGDTELLTVLNFLDCESGCMFSCAVDKGPGDYPVSVVCKGLQFCGRKRIVMRTDNENAITALSKAVCEGRTDETALESGPKYSSASMGAIEVANRAVEGQIRAIRSRLEEVLRTRIEITDPIVPWLVRHASWLLNGYRISWTATRLIVPSEDVSMAVKS